MSKGNNLQSLFYGILFCISVTALIIACLAFTKKGGGEYYINNNLPCFTGGDGEWGEREVADKHTHPDSSVLEIGGGEGSVTVIIQKKLNNPTNHVVIQPADDGWHGIEKLRKNKKSCNGEFTIIDHILKPGEGKELLEMVSKPFDTIVVDCEGCLHKEFEKNPDLFKYVTQIQVERDDREISLTATGGPYEKLLKNDLGMKLVHTGKGCFGNCVTEVWEKNRDSSS
tara:strand:+ start:24 stop:704 length:681 start_codon:yes stop_codon:yes gene_type:complete